MSTCCALLDLNIIHFLILVNTIKILFGGLIVETLSLRVRCCLGAIMKERGLNNKQVVELTGISRNTITSLAANATNQINYDTLARLCIGLGLQPGDILQLTSEE